MRVNIPNTTLVAVSSTKIPETIYALQYCLAKASFQRAILLTSADVKNLGVVEVVKIEPLRSVDEYSNFVIYRLHEYINTSHCLIVQWDGFLTNGRLWDESFLDFDYIGAPFKMRDNDPTYSADDSGKFYAVGNGGFSLRSKALLEAPTKLKLKSPVWSRSKNEDGFFCVEQRRVLENEGFRWAPIEIAQKFSNECGLRDWAWFRQSFGFHGKRLLLRHKVIGRWLNNGY